MIQAMKNIMNCYWKYPTKAQKAVETIPEDALNFALSSRPDKSQRIPEIIQEAQTLIEGE